MLEEDVVIQEPNENLESDKTLENDVEITEEDLSSVEEETSKRIQTAIAQKKHWREKFEKTQKELEELKNKSSTEKKQDEKPEKQEKPDKKVKSDDEIDYKKEFLKTNLRISNPDLTVDEVEKAIKYSEVEEKDPMDIVNSPYFMAMVNDRKEREKIEKGTPSPSGRTSSVSQQNYQKFVDNPGLIKELDEKQYKKFVEWQEGRGAK
jgi:hypothetical protein